MGKKPIFVCSLLVTCLILNLWAIPDPFNASEQCTSILNLSDTWYVCFQKHRFLHLPNLLFSIIWSVCWFYLTSAQTGWLISFLGLHLSNENFITAWTADSNWVKVYPTESCSVYKHRGRLPGGYCLGTDWASFGWWWAIAVHLHHLLFLGFISLSSCYFPFHYILKNIILFKLF